MKRLFFILFSCCLLRYLRWPVCTFVLIATGLQNGLLTVVIIISKVLFAKFLLKICVAFSILQMIVAFGGTDWCFCLIGWFVYFGSVLGFWFLVFFFWFEFFFAVWDVFLFNSSFFCTVEMICSCSLSLSCWLSSLLVSSIPSETL